MRDAPRVAETLDRSELARPDEIPQAADLVESTLREEDLREGEEHFRVIANSAPVLIWMSGTDEEITSVDQPWLDYAAARGAAVETSRATLLCPDEAERCREVCKKAFEQRAPFQLEYRLGRREGEYRWVMTAGVPRYNANGSFVGYIGTTIDVTEQKLAEGILFGQKLIDVHEEVSSRIARELHDDISQRLGVVSLRLGSLKRASPPSATELQQQIDEISQEIADLGADIQAVSHRLHPATLEILGLEKAAAGFCEALSERHGVTIDVHLENVPAALPPEIALSLFRVLQEALQNVVKHSGSRRAQVSLSGRIETVHLTVKDSGVGFDPHQSARGPALGMTSMKERLTVVGGQLSVHSQRGNGTIIQAIAPLRLPTPSKT